MADETTAAPGADAPDPRIAAAIAAAKEPAEEGGKNVRLNPGEIYAVLQEAGMELTRDLDGECFVSFDGARFNRHHLAGRAVEDEMRSIIAARVRCRNADGEPRVAMVSKSAMDTVLRTMRAAASRQMQQRHHLRVAEMKDGVWIDIGDAGWNAIRVTRGGWSVRDARHVPFLRPSGLQALALPKADPNVLRELRALVPGIADVDFPALLFFALAALWPRGPYPLLVLSGLAGSGKSSLAASILATVDPHQLGLGEMPEKLRDALTQGLYRRVLANDNLSRLTPEQSDMLCRRCDGSHAAYRTNYSDRDLTVVASNGPTILTTISSLVGRSDLASRCLFLPVAARGAGEYLEASHVEARMARLRPGLLALLLDAMVAAIGRLAARQVPQRVASRLAGFERLARAAGPAMGLTDVEVYAFFARQHELGVLAVADNSPVVAALLDFLAKQAGDELMAAQAWRGTMSTLLAGLNEANPSGRFAAEWPKDPAALRHHLAQAGGTLEALGVKVLDRKAGKAEDKRAGAWRWVEVTYPPADRAPLGEVDGAGCTSVH